MIILQATRPPVYHPNYFDLALSGLIGFFIGKFGDALIKKANIVTFLIKNRWKLKKINEKQFTNILPLDHAEFTYQPQDIHIHLSSKHLYFSPHIEFKDKLINLFGQRRFKTKDQGLGFFDFSKIENFNHHLEINKRNVSLQFIQSAEKVHPLFNGQKLGILNIQIERIADTNKGKIHVDLYKTDYFTHRVSRSIYRWLNSSHNFGSKLDQNSFNDNFRKYNFLNTSLGIYIIVHVNEGLVFCKRSTIVSNSEEAGKWHVSVDEGLDIQDLRQETVDVLQFAERGIFEELGIPRNILDKHLHSKIRFLDLFLEKKRYEMVLSAYVKLYMGMNELKEFYKTARDGEYETTDIICIEASHFAINNFFNKQSVTEMAKYCVERLMAREILSEH